MYSDGNSNSNSDETLKDGTVVQLMVMGIVIVSDGTFKDGTIVLCIVMGTVIVRVMGHSKMGQ